MYLSGRVGDEAKKRKSPTKSGRVGITGYAYSIYNRTKQKTHISWNSRWPKVTRLLLDVEIWTQPLFTSTRNGLFVQPAYYTDHMQRSFESFFRKLKAAAQNLCRGNRRSRKPKKNKCSFKNCGRLPEAVQRKMKTRRRNFLQRIEEGCLVAFQWV